MTVATEVAYAERAWTGVENDFAPGMSAQSAAHIGVKYRDAQGILSVLTAGVHLSVSKAGEDGVVGAISSAPLHMPAAPGTVIFERTTPALQQVDFQTLEDFDPSVHTNLADAAALRAAELRNRQNRAITPFTVFVDYADFGTYRVAGADPVNDRDFATRGYVLQITGILSLQGFVDQAAASAAAASASETAGQAALVGAEAARDKSQLWADQAENTEVQPGEFSAFHWSQKASAAANQILPYLTTSDDGLFGDVDTGNIDDGAFP